MHLPDHEFVKPATLADSLALLRSASGEIKLIAGGTDVVYNMRGRLFQPDILLSVRDLAELQGVADTTAGGIRIGAGIRLTDLEHEPRVAAYPALVTAGRAVASRHVRNMATLGGNLCLDTRCWYTNQTAEWRQAKGPCLKNGVAVCHAIKSASVCVALNASDIAPALIALNADITLANVDGERRLPLTDFYTDDGVTHTIRDADELLVAIDLPAPSGRTVFIKETARKGNDFSYAVIAAGGEVAGQRVTGLRIVLGCLTTRPLSLQEPVRIIETRGLTDEAIDVAAAAARDELGPLTNLYTPAAYKSSLARSLVRQALRELRDATP
ncbi:MAG: FAD binding domain-containing protein [Gammaproteobacteria bacterium]|nr:FAD binding domain-containing protein [Gammaproteobacteria bacterium]